MIKKNSFWRKTFGKKFGISDFLLLAVLFAYPTYYYFHVQIGFVLINAGFDAILTDLGAYVWGGVVISFIIKNWLRKVRK